MSSIKDGFKDCPRCKTKVLYVHYKCPNCGHIFSEENDDKAEVDEYLDSIFSVLDNENRRKILGSLVSGSKTRNDLSKTLGNIALEAVARHCVQLKEIDLIFEELVPNDQKGGPKSIYTINMYGLNKAIDKISDFYSTFTDNKSLESNETLTLDNFYEMLKIRIKMNKDLKDRYWIIIDSCEWDGKAYPVDKDQVIIGRNDDRTDISISYDKHVSRFHCKITFDKEQKKYFVEDTKSANGTLIKDTILKNKRSEIVSGDRFKIGKTWLLFKRM